MGWRRGEVWFDTEVVWFGERARSRLALAAPSFAALAAGGAFAPTIPSGLAASRQRRAQRRHKERSRRAGAAALLIGSASILPLAAHRYGSTAAAALGLAEDPPSATFRFGPGGLEVAESSVPPQVRRLRAEAAADRAAAARAKRERRELTRAAAPTIEWSHASSRGLPYSGSLVDGTQLPVEGPDWVTWNPVADRVPNEPHRLYGHERTIRTIVAVLAAYRAAHPEAARVVVGDISFRGGGRMDQHVSHQNGLDVDVYYPRHDEALQAPVSRGQVDRARAQDLLDRFVAAGAQKVFVGFSTGLHGPSGVVVPYPNHENHMHVRFPPPG
jgi:Penicillin-insensitive murein endopeptidase